jgi:subtilisin family serine protease
VNQASWTLATPPTELFSSEGPTNDGRLKPDLVAPDGTTSLTYGPLEGFGTSFSAPTTAGAAALLLHQGPDRTAADLRALLIADAHDVGPAGADPVYGAGELVLPPPVPFAPPRVLIAIGALLGVAGAVVLTRSRIA